MSESKGRKGRKSMKKKKSYFHSKFKFSYHSNFHKTWDQEAVDFLLGLILQGDCWKMFRSGPFVGARKLKTIASEIVNHVAWSSLYTFFSWMFKGQQTFIENLQCKSQGRGHGQIKDLELWVAQCGLLLHRLVMSVPSVLWCIETLSTTFNKEKESLRDHGEVYTCLCVW